MSSLHNPTMPEGRVKYTPGAKTDIDKQLP